MDVPDQFQQVRVLLTQDGLVAVLEKMAAPMVAEVIADSVSREDPTPGNLAMTCERLVAPARINKWA